MKLLLKSSLLIFSLFLFIYSCSKDSPLPAPTPTVTYTLSVSASEGGTVNNTGGTHNENSNVTISATADAGYEFTSWSGDASGTDNPLTVSMNSNKTITANFIRTQYTLSLGKIGEGTITQEVISSDKTSEEYNSGDVVRLNATPSSGSIFNSWSGSSTETTNQIDVTIDGTKSVTATFEETISQVLGSNDAFLGVGKWKIRKKTGGTEASKSAECELLAIIFRMDGSFTIITSTATITGQFIVDSNTTISLTQSQSPFGTITNLVLTNSFISFSLSLNSGCSEDGEGDKDDDYNEDTDTSLPPVISLVGSSTINLGVGDNYTDAGATAEDNVDGDLTSSITSSGTVDTATEGTYLITYTVSDAAGNSVSITRTVIVSLDLPPTITLTGSSTITLLVGDTYTEDGCVATDQEDGDITASITTSGTVDVSNTGTYTLVYSVSDSGNNFVSVTRTVIVNPLPDTTPPTITLTGSSTINLTVGDNYTDAGATATDDVDGNITSSITTSGAISTSNTGTFIISYSVSDAAGNAATVVQRTVIVSAATNSSNCTITGQNIGGGQSQTVTLTNAISDITFSVNSSCQENLQAEALGLPTGVTMNFSNNTAIISGTPSGQTGNYPYDVNWYSSTSTFTLGGTITVVAGSSTSTSTTSSSTADTTAPVITLIGSSTINLTVGDTFTDPGATATDDVDGDLTSSISITGTVDTSTVGTYTLTYSVADAASNSASTTRTVIVNAAATTNNSGNISFVNGTCQCPNATEGDTDVINGVTYTAVDDNSIAAQIANGNVNLCTTLVTYMSSLFRDNSSFNSDISFWDTSNVTNMALMFRAANTFNQNIGNWNTSSVENMNEMFRNAWAFNKDIGSWDTSNVSSMGNMFASAFAFNQNIGNWDTSNVTDMSKQFKAAEVFNQDLTGWCVSSITSEPTEFVNLSSALIEANKPLWGKEFTVALTTGSNSQTVTGTAAITDVKYTATPICAGSISASVSGLPPGVSMVFANNVATISGTPSATGTFNYSLTFTGASTTQTTGTITVNAAANTYSISVTASSNSDYTLSGTDRNGTVSGDDASLTINAGDTLNFSVNAASHPFYIKTVQGTGTDNQVSNVTNNGATSGVVNWTPTAAGTYYYQCSAHNGMYGTITVQ